MTAGMSSRIDFPEARSREAWLVTRHFGFTVRLRPFGFRVTWMGTGHLSVGPWWCE